MDDVPIVGRDDEQRVFKQFLAHYDAPAYVRRARRVEQALDDLLARCRRQRDEWLGMVRSRLRALLALAGDWAALRPLLGGGQVQTLRELHAALSPGTSAAEAATSSQRALRRALGELVESLERFNRRWRAYLAEIDLRPVNELRDGYNRYYLLEKECAMRSWRLAQQGFRRLEPLTAADLAGLLPPLPVPRGEG